MESCSIIKDGKGKNALGEEEVRRIWKDLDLNLNSTGTQEEDAVR